VGFIDARAIAQQFVGMYRWRTAMGPTVLTLEEERVKAAKPGSEFRECSSGCPIMVVVATGRFIMGSPEQESDRQTSEGPQREVALARPFAVSKFKVTFEEFDACVAAAGCGPVADHWGRGKMPVINAAWGEARQHALESACFVVCATAWLDADQQAQIMNDTGCAAGPISGGCFTAIVGPAGRLMAGPLEAGEGDAMANLDLAQIDARKRLMDARGHNSLPELLSLLIDRTRRARPRAQCARDCRGAGRAYRQGGECRGAASSSECVVAHGRQHHQTSGRRSTMSTIQLMPPAVSTASIADPIAASAAKTK
jgi:hypothetical protein